MLTIDLNRLRDDILELSKIGYNPQTKGITRQGLTQSDYEGRLWLMDRFRSLGLEPVMDGACNVLCRYGDAGKPSVMIGSHLDSVTDGGMFDGALGVLVGLECLRVIKDSGLALQYPVEVVAFSEEEGRFGGMFGVQALCGQISPDWIETAQDVEGKLLKDEMIALGLNPMDALSAYREKETIHAYLELHIEQGPVLDAMKQSIGIVEGITGVFDWVVRFIGKANHAGTTPMESRRDAFLALADFAHELTRIIAENGSELSRLTIGRVDIKPGHVHVVPGEVEFTLTGRDLDEEVMWELAKACRKVLSAIARSKDLMFEYQEKAWLSPKHCSPKMIELLTRNTEKLGHTPHRMPSGAGHDAQFMADITDAGMIFVPSVGGTSHAPTEWTNWVDIEKGANVLLQSCLELVT